jgi:ribosomal protein S3
MKRIINLLFNSKKKEVKQITDKSDFAVKQGILMFCENEAINFDVLQVHYIKTTTTEKLIDIEITLGRPGSIIGKGGRTIDALNNHLVSFFDKPVLIKLIEFNAWS